MDLLASATGVEVAGRDVRVAVLPVGSFEQHGEHLPLVTDTVVACVISAWIARSYNLLRLPPITISCSHEHEDFPGSFGAVSITAATLINVIDDIRASLARASVTKLAIVNGHGGNYVLSNIAQQANVDGRHVTLFPGREDWDAARGHAGVVTTNHDDMHAGELETSILLHTHPEFVRGTYKGADHEATSRPHLLVTGLRGYTTSGVIGRPSEATATKGEAILESLVASFAAHLRVLERIRDVPHNAEQGNLSRPG